MFRNLKTKIILVAILLLFLPSAGKADYLGQRTGFFIDQSYDSTKRGQIVATLQKITDKLYFYVDDEWWNSATSQKRDELNQFMVDISSEFENKIYPILTSNFGSEWKPGIDNDEKITILLHPMIEEAGGYFNSSDEYRQAQSPRSNEREMMYLNTKYLQEDQVKSFLAHEFMHMITFYQKEKYGADEEVWLNEARSEYASTLVGYDDIYAGSNLERRVRNFLEKPTDSLTEWQNLKYDYGTVNLFIQYLVEHYGKEVLISSLQSDKTGITSLNYALLKNNYKEDFSQIFTDWAITVLVNDCSLVPYRTEGSGAGFGQKYCYTNNNLKSLRIAPQLNFLPASGNVSLSTLDITKNWAGNWYKIIGGRGTLNFEFDGDDQVNFEVPYLLCDNKDQCSIKNLLLDKQQKGIFSLVKFNDNYSSVTIIPLIESKISGFNGDETNYFFNWKASTVEKTKEEIEKEEKEKTAAQIELLQKQIIQLQAQINAILGRQTNCKNIGNNLYFGMVNNVEVRCLQQFLKNQGAEIYPEGLVTGNFLSLTQIAVIRFQEKYASEILTPIGLEKGTGFVGQKTREKINFLLSY